MIFSLALSICSSKVPIASSCAPSRPVVAATNISLVIVPNLDAVCIALAERPIPLRVALLPQPIALPVPPVRAVSAIPASI